MFFLIRHCVISRKRFHLFSVSDVRVRCELIVGGWGYKNAKQVENIIVFGFRSSICNGLKCGAGIACHFHAECSSYVTTYSKVCCVVAQTIDVKEVDSPRTKIARLCGEHGG